jgi:hypothetical protein
MALFLRIDEASEERLGYPSERLSEFTLVLLSRFWRRWYCLLLKLIGSDFFNVYPKH